MPRSTPESTLRCLLILFATAVIACTTPGSLSNNSPEDSVSAVSETPDDALRSFVAAWNSRDYPALRATFHPDRRGLLDANRADVEARMARLEVRAAEVSSVCHPRGGAWKHATFQVVSPDSPNSSPNEPSSDAAWLRASDEAWWMYSL